MALTLYNTLTRKKEEFAPITPGLVRFYSCGPTVYNYAHIGNLRTYIFNDILRRILSKNNYKLRHVMNITDVGHLSSDADEGEDKMLLGAAREKKTVWEIAQYYTDAFFRDTGLLNIEKPEIVCRATEHIPEMIDLIKRIEKNGFSYLSEGNVYFDTSKLDDYGKLAMLKVDELRGGARVDVDENKRNHSDFVLWFTKSKFQDQEMKWDSPWGTGYPGWHVECSAMSMKYLGEQFDIHTGGIDHIPVHHTNEIAQSEAATGKSPWVRFWLHGEFLVLDKGKMSKSSGGFLTLQTLLDKGIDPLAYRYFCLSAHYRMPLTFSWEALEGAANALKSLKNRISEIKKQADASAAGGSHAKDDHLFVEEYKQEFMARINDDLNMPRAVATLHDMLKDDGLTNRSKLSLVNYFDDVLGLSLGKEDELMIPEDVLELVERREHARKHKDFAQSDKLREEISARGFVVEDAKSGPRVKKL